MSLWCGACRKEIFEGFGMLYELERTPQGIRLPQSGSKVPPNSAICAVCIRMIPEGEFANDHAAVDSGAATVYAYIPADSSRNSFSGSKSWSDIAYTDAGFRFLPRTLVEQRLPRAIEIIDQMAGRRKAPQPTLEITTVEITEPGSFLRALAEARGVPFDEHFLRAIAEEFGGQLP